MLQFQYSNPESITITLNPYTPRLYGKQVHITQQQSTTSLLDKTGITRVRQVVGICVFYARAIDNNLSMGLNTIATKKRL